MVMELILGKQFTTHLKKMDYKDIELDEEELTTPLVSNKFHFNISDADLKLYLTRCIKASNQFKKFPDSHKSKKSLMYGLAIYEALWQRVFPDKPIPE